MARRSSLDPVAVQAMLDAGQSTLDIANRLGTSRRAVQLFARTRGLVHQPRKGRCQKANQRPMPDDFAERARTMSAYALFQHYRSSYATIQRWLAEAGIETEPRQGGSPMKVIPRDIFAQYPDKPHYTVAKLVGVDPKTLSAHIKAGRVDPPHAKRRDMPRADVAGQPKAAIAHVFRDHSDAGQAVDFLRRFGPVSKRGDQWLRGSRLMSGDEVVALAERKGWKRWDLAA